MADIFTVCVLKSFAILTRKHTCWSLFFNKVAELKTWNFIKKRLQHRRNENNDKFFGTTFFIEHLWWLLLIKVLMMAVVYWQGCSSESHTMANNWRSRQFNKCCSRTVIGWYHQVLYIGYFHGFVHINYLMHLQDMYMA